MADDDECVPAFTHTRLLVTEFDACFRFYRDVLGFEVTWGGAGEDYADFDTGATTLALFDKRAMAEAVGTETLPPSGDRMDDVCVVFEVDDLDRAYEELVGEVPFVTEPHDREGWGIRVAHLRDPAGTLLELNEPLE